MYDKFLAAALLSKAAFLSHLDHLGVSAESTFQIPGPFKFTSSQ
jgi:hypothetical protein